MKVYKEIKSTGNSKYVDKCKKYFSLKMSLEENWLFKSKIIIIYSGVFNICRNKKDGNNTKDRMREKACCCMMLTVFTMW